MKHTIKAQIKLEPQEGLPIILKEGELYHFEKRQPRWFHEGIEARLVNKDNKTVAIVRIINPITYTEEKNGKIVGITRGDYQVIKLYNGN